MKKYLVNYADKNYRNTQAYNTKTGIEVANFDGVFEYGPDSLDEGFRKEYFSILSQRRGGGYWLWKPYIILDALRKIEYGDFLFYADAGSYFISSIEPLLKACEDVSENESIFSFALPFLEVQYTKQDIFKSLGMDTATYKENIQRMATFILIKKTDASLAFFVEFLKWATKEDLITDAESQQHFEDIRFIENRHDQSIFSLLCKKFKVPVMRDPSEYGIEPLLYPSLWKMKNQNNELYQSIMKSYNEEIIRCDYPQIIVEHRWKSVNRRTKMEAYIRRKCKPLVWRNYVAIKRGVKTLIAAYVRKG